MKNGVMMQYFEWNLPNDGKLWVHLKEDAKHLHDIGITSVWIPPAYKADEQQDEGYAVYDSTTWGVRPEGTVRTKYGTRHELEEAVTALHENGIAVYLDTVMNQKTGADYTEKFMACEVDPENREQVIARPSKSRGGRDTPFRDAATNILPSNGTGTTSREPTKFTRPANGPSTSSRAKARSGAKASTARTGTTIS